MARDWLSTLWPASYKGVPFWVEKDDFDGGRRIASHEFANRDDPLHEDLGSALKKWEVTAYVASDTADLETMALEAVLDTAGPGPLVLPMDGPVLARAHKWRRARDKDKAGYLALSLTFLREGTSFLAVTVSSLAQAVFDEVDRLGGVCDLLGGAIAVVNLVDWVSDDVIGGFVDLAAGLDLVVGVIIDDVAATSRFVNALSAVVGAIEDGADLWLDSTVGAAFVALGLDTLAEGVTAGAVLCMLARAIADAAIEADPIGGPDRVVEAFADWTSSDPVIAPSTASTASRLAAGRNATALDVIRRVVGIGVTAEAIVRSTYPSRREGIAARVALAIACERAVAALSSLGSDVAADPIRGLLSVRDATVEWLTRAIADLAPVRTVQLSAELPAVVVAWVLYADPSRAPELVSRNRVTHPAFMPRTFEALVT